ncbi:MAG: hypothetical protein LBD25_06965 [Coriobacteriales bacterium]|jgi:hypothetical protein|nr:hypothetical protein [Coriobacteriales bacterium]
MFRIAKKLMPFVGGLVVASVVLGIVVSKNPRLRAEAEQQTRALLDALGNGAAAIQDIAEKAQEAVVAVKKETGAIQQKKSEERRQLYEQQWNQLNKLYNENNKHL